MAGTDLFSDPNQQTARLDKLQAQLSDLAKSMQLAQRTRQVAALNMFRGQFKELSRAAAALRDELNRSDTPSQLMKAMDQFSDKAIAVAKEFGADASALTKGAARFLSNLPLVIGGLAVVAVVVAALYYLPRRKRAA